MFGRWPGWAPVRPDSRSAAPSEGSRPMLSEREVSAAIGTTALGHAGAKVGTESVPTTRVRVVRYVVTEEVQVTVPIRREEIRLEEVPLDAPDPGPGESLTPAADDVGGGLPDEIVLHAERPVVTVEVVPTERVRLRTEVVAGQETVTGQVQ